MSNYTSFGGPSSYAQQQWPPPSNPPPSSSMPSILPHNFPNPSDYNRPQDGSNNVNGFDANSRLPGLGVGAAGPLPPPPFPFMGPSQFPPPPFPPFQMPFLGYPPMQMPTPMQTQPTPLSTNEPSFPNPVGMSNATGPQTDHPTNSRPEFDQEEGEVTDGESWNPMPSENEKTPAHVVSAHTVPGVNGLKEPPHTEPERTMSDMEEGEASSSASHASSRDSGSPYNPPMSVTADSPEPVREFQHGIVESSRPADISQKENEHQVPSRPGKSPVQLRVQAQGALLSLAPHNIRYEELVREGINPVILRQLYEDVGIKVQTPPSDTTKDGPSELERPVVNQNQSAAAQSTSITDTVDPAQRQGSAKRNDNKQQPSPLGRPPSACQPGTNKPMERKEVIARMLAAKAAKTPGPSPSPQASVAKETPAESVNISSESPAKEKDVPVREKNKAQTELARKRIEELKKQGLMRNQQKSQPDSISQDQPQRSEAIEQPLAAANVVPVRSQHPLPERPPQPEVPPARLPGLFMTDSNQSPPPESHVTPIQSLALDPTPQPRVTQRKRPRASDFDEPSNTPREGFSQRIANSAPEERLVIDISDDELYGDGENDHMDLETPADLAQSSDSFMASVDPSGSSTAVAPRVNDQDHIRKKDLEIREMHRKIAELEQRKKTKLTTSRTQSPRALDSPNSSPPDNPAGADLQSNVYANESPIVNNDSDTMLVAPDTHAAPGLNGHPEGPPPIDLDSMNLSQLAVMRSKILRKREIELGLPDLDAEIRSSEAQLSELHKDEEQLSLNIARGKQGRQRLIGELEELGLETNGLTLEVLDAAQRKLESQELSSPSGQAYTLPPNICDNIDTPMPDASLLGQEEAKGKLESPEVAGPSRQEPQAGIDLISTLSGPSNDHSVVEPEGETSHAYGSDSTGSSMDESSDSSSTGSVSDSQEELDEPIPGNDLPQVTEEPTVDEQRENDRGTDHDPDTLPERGQDSTDISPDEASSISGSQSENDRQASRASSVVSEAYEPPEPEADSGSVGSEYTPPFSPVFHGPEEPEISPRPLPNQPQAEEPLTGKVQELGADVRGPVQNVPENQATEHKFSPYKSPLRSFKAYRYHPNYPDAVSDGYRSLTYSHNIDPMKYLCPFEAAGGVCNDRSCESQHFRDMTLSDDKILVQMGSLREGKTPEEKDQYITGLKQIINEMRRDKVKDFNTVATEIAAYRRRFLQDPSRVLPL